MSIVGTPTFTNVYSRFSDKMKQRERIDAYTQDALVFLASVIDIENFEEQTGLSSKLFQMIKYSDGMVGLAKHGDDFVMCEVTQVGMPDKNLKPVEVIAKYWHNQKLYCENKTVGKDIILLCNNEMLEPELDAYRVANALANCDLSLSLNVRNSRLLPIFKARDEKDRATFEQTVKAMDSGQMSLVWGDDVTKDELLGIEREPMLSITDPTCADKIQYLLETHDNYSRFFYNKYGLYTSGNAKHAQQSKMEIDNGESASWVYPFMFLDETDKFCKLANDLFGLSIEAHLSDLHSLLWQKFITQNRPAVAETITTDNVKDVVENGASDITESVDDVSRETSETNERGLDDEKTV